MTEAIPHLREMLRHERWRSVFRPRPSRRMAEYYLSSDAVKFCVE
jgi:hypothetical protein